jgi:hypothetical protein
LRFEATVYVKVATKGITIAREERLKSWSLMLQMNLEGLLEEVFDRLDGRSNAG